MTAGLGVICDMKLLQEALIHHHEVEELLRKLTLEEKASGIFSESTPPLISTQFCQVDILTGKTMWEACGMLASHQDALTRFCALVVI